MYLFLKRRYFILILIANSLHLMAFGSWNREVGRQTIKSTYAVFSQLEWTLLQVCVSCPGVCVSRPAREGKKRTAERKKTLERETHREGWKLGEISQQTVSCAAKNLTSLIKQNNCWTQLAPMVSDAPRCSRRRERNYLTR